MPGYFIAYLAFAQVIPFVTIPIIDEINWFLRVIVLTIRWTISLLEPQSYPIDHFICLLRSLRTARCH